MIRFIAALALGFQGFGYVFAAIRYLVVLGDVVPGVGIVFGIFWGTGAFFAFASSIVLFKSRGQRNLRGGGWSVGLILLTCGCIGFLAMGFAALGVFAYHDLEMTARTERLLRGFLLGIAGQSALVSILGFLAVLMPLRKPRSVHRDLEIATA